MICILCFGFQGTEIHGAQSVGLSRMSPVQSHKSTRTSIRQVAKLLAGLFVFFSSS